MVLEIGGASRIDGGLSHGAGETAESAVGAGRPETRIGVRADSQDGEEAFAAGIRAQQDAPAEPLAQQQVGQAGDEDGASIYEDAVDHQSVSGGTVAGGGGRLSDDELAGAQDQINALQQAKTGRAPNTGDTGRDNAVSQSIANDPMATLHQTSLSQAIGKMQQAITDRDPQALESATKNALQSAKDLDGVRNDHEKNAMTRASLGTSQTSLGETQRQNRFSRISMGVAGGVGIAGIAVAGTVGGIAANKNLNG